MYVRDAVCKDRVFLGPTDVLDAGNCSIMNTPWDFLPMASYDPALCLGGKQVQVPSTLDWYRQLPLPALPQVPYHTGLPPVTASNFHATTSSSNNDASPIKKRRGMKRSVSGRQKD